MEAEVKIPQSYEQWLSTLHVLGKTTVSAKTISNLKKGNCPGIENLLPEFEARVQETVNLMLTRTTKRCTKAINEALSENDFGNIEVIMRRYRGEMRNCRFYLYIDFLPKGYIEKLDFKVTEEIARYWKELRKYLMELMEETEDSRLYDMVYYLKRMG